MEHRVALAAGALAATLIVSGAIWSYGTTRAALLAEMRANVKDEVTLLGQGTLARARSLEAEVARISASAVLREAIADSNRRPQRLHHLVREHDLGLAHWGRLRLVDAGGRVVVPRPAPGTPGYSGRPWWGTLVELGQAHVELSLDGAPTLLLASPVVATDGWTMEGALVLELPLQSLLEEVAAGLGPKHIARLWYDDRVLATTGVAEEADDDSPIRQTVHIDDGPAAGIAVSLEVPRSAALRPLDSVAHLYALGGAVALLLTSLVARWSARLLMARIRALSAAAERVSMDDTASTHFDVTGDDEHAQLARSLQRMVDRLGAAHASLETRVAERTADLEFAETRLRTILDNMLDGVVTADEQGRIESFNLSAERIFGWKAQEVVGRGLGCLMEAPARPAHETHLQRYQATGERKLIGTAREVRAVKKDGAPVPIELLVSECALHGRRLYIAQVRDVTERQRVERMKDDFVSVVSHELRTPLTSIRGALGLLAGGVTGPLPGDAEKLTRIALENGARLGRLIDDLLDVQRIEAGQFTLHVTPLPLADCVREAVELNQAFARRLNVRIALTGVVPDVQLSLDPSRFQQVMSNLLSNAAKFSPAGTRVEVWSAAMDGGRVRIEVRDQGPGIPAAFRSRVFEKFSQADASSERAREGTGLGLAISKALVERMGGTIGFTSEEGQGTTFFLEFPVTDPARRPAA